MPSGNTASPPCSAVRRTSEAWPYPTKERSSRAYSVEQRQSGSVGDSVCSDHSLVGITLQLSEDKVVVMKGAGKILPNGSESSAGSTCGGIE